MKKAAVLGSPVEHSLSPLLYKAGFEAAGLDDWDFERIECTAEDLPRLVGNAPEEYRGFAVTMPGKFAALEFADEVSERAQIIGVANTLVRTSRGWSADNTDGEGVVGALEELLGERPEISDAVLIGAGGTARPALWALGTLGAKDVTVVNRSNRADELAGLVDRFGLEASFVDFDADLEKISMDADVVISTVPAAGLEEYAATLGHAPTFDVIYDPWPTPLVVRAAANGYRTVGGHVMLANQAFSQFERITGVSAPRTAMKEALEAHLS